MKRVMTQSKRWEHRSTNGMAKGRALCRGAGCPRKPPFLLVCSPPQAASKPEGRNGGRAPNPRSRVTSLTIPLERGLQAM